MWHIFSDQLEEGDSGSVVCVEIEEIEEEKCVIGLLQGKRRTPTDCPDHIYEAIILCHALTEVESEYPQLVGRLTHYSTKVTGPRPPCTN